MSNGDQYNLVRRGKFWVADFTLHGQRVHRSTKCVIKADAIERCDLWAKEIRDRKDGITPKPIAPTLRKAYDEWKRIKKGVVSDGHMLNMRCAIETHAKEFLETQVDAISNRVIEQIRSDYMNSHGRGYRSGQAWEAKRTHSAGGANTVVKMLSSLLGWCVEQGHIEHMPFKVKKLKAQESVKGVLWPEQVKPFLAEVDKGGRSHSKQPDKKPEHSATAIRMMIALGLRESEALGARWEWLDRRRGVYIVGQAKDRTVRAIPVPAWLMAHLNEIHAASGNPSRGFILVGSIAKDGTELPHSKNFTQKPVSRVSSVLKIEGLTPHRLRATFATAHFEAGTPISQIQQMMGHDDPQTTMGYIVQRPKDQILAQSVVAEMMGFTN